MAEIIDGKALSVRIRNDLKERIAALPYKIGLAVVIVGHDPASEVYVRNKVRACNEVGILSYHCRMPEDSTQEEVELAVLNLVKSEQVHGVLVQLPLPKHLDQDKILKLIPTQKDVDGFNPENMGLLALNKPNARVSCTPLGVMQMLKSINVPLRGANAVIVGASNIVGRPMALCLINEGATVTICRSTTRDLAAVTRTADILVVAIGKAEYITADMVKQGAVVIDVGINRTADGKLVGDVDYENVKEVASYITPVPGGVGPMTITMLLYNTYLSAASAEESV